MANQYFKLGLILNLIFQENQKKTRRCTFWEQMTGWPHMKFCLTLLDEDRLWYETLGAQQLDWEGLQDHFWQQYSKFGNTREQYFHAWRSFHYDENTDTIDSYIYKVKQVAALLNYGESQILELFKKTLPSRLYCMLYQIDDLRMAVETAKRLLTKRADR